MDLPDWAVQIWEAMGSPDLQDLQSVHNGDLLERRHGLRKDDIVEILIDARALVEGEANTLVVVLVTPIEQQDPILLSIEG